MMLLSIFSPIFILYPIADIEVLARKELFIFSFLLTYLFDRVIANRGLDDSPAV